MPGTIVASHTVKWFVWAEGQKLPRTAVMRGLWGYDAECSCGWQSRTGGATKRSVDHMLWEHKLDVRSASGKPA